MKKRTDYEEFLRLLEETIEDILHLFDVTDEVLCWCIVEEVKHGLPVDILETESNLYVVIALPGMQKRDIRLKCTGSVLEIRAKNDEIILNERVELPVKVNKTGIKSTYRKGILEVVLNKPKRHRTHQ